MEKRVRVILGLACMAAFTLAMSTTVRAQNLLVDPGAEGAVTGAGGIGGWGLFNGASFSSTVALSGTNSIKEFGGGGFSVPGAFQTFSAVPGEVATMTGFGWLDAAVPTNATSFGGLQITYFAGPGGTGANLGTVETSPGNALFSTVKLNGFSPLQTWIPISVTATAPAGAQSIQCFAIVIDQTPTHAYFDDMTLVPEPSTVAMALTGLLGLVAFAKKRRV